MNKNTLSNVGRAGLAALSLLLAAAPLPAQIKKVNTPAQAISLDEQERVGGHTLERHVGKDAEFIKTRLTDEGVPAASTFRDKATATAMVQAALEHNKVEINKHLFEACMGPANVAYDYEAGHDIGSYLETGNLTDKKGRERNSAEGKALKTGATSVKVVVKYTCTARASATPVNSFIVLTAFPNPK